MVDRRAEGSKLYQRSNPMKTSTLVTLGVVSEPILASSNDTVAERQTHIPNVKAGNTKEGSITVLLTSCLTGLESAV